VFFDQGFVQAVSSAAVVAGNINPAQIGFALDAVPQADVLVRLNAPREILEKRLTERRDRQGRIERLFDTWANLDSIRIFDQLHELLRARGREVACVDSSGHRGLQQGAELVETLVRYKFDFASTRTAEATDGSLMVGGA
jgi:hypothetical protein